MRRSRRGRLSRSSYFNPRTHVGCDTSTPIHNSSCQNFNPRTHVGCDPALTALMTLSAEFQSTHPRGVRRTLRRTTVTPTRYFNPRTHVGCDERRVDVPHGYAISIHAPTWGATPTDVVSSANLAFQSTHPRGVRQSCRGHFQDFRNFNPRTHVGCDDIFRCVSPDDLEFQSTHPRGVRLILSIQEWWARNFNPRTHVGCDIGGLPVPCVGRISIHAPTWGATEFHLDCNTQKEFQSTHPRGVRPLLLPLSVPLSRFQSTHPRGVRPEAENKRADTGLFQSTHPRGVRLISYGKI